MLSLLYTSICIYYMAIHKVLQKGFRKETSHVLASNAVPYSSGLRFAMKPASHCHEAKPSLLYQKQNNPMSLPARHRIGLKRQLGGGGVRIRKIGIKRMRIVRNPVNLCKSEPIICS
jgi:hypothetical protein